MSGGNVKLESLTKRFDEVTAVDDISVEIQPGEFFSLLGPSGCGKTTTLRMVAGLRAADRRQDPARRRRRRQLAAQPPQRQHGLPELRAVPVPDRRRERRLRHEVQVGAQGRSCKTRVAEALELVQLSGYEKRRPNQLSGGQQQRVALARALVLRPSVLLLDEPLGALDAKLRRTLQVELGALQEQVGITFLYVTHDQEEALTMSDRLAVMNHGRIVQLGTPEEVYNEPADAYVADFLGVSNLMDARVEPGGDGSGPCRLRLGDFTSRGRGGPARRHRRGQARDPARTHPRATRTRPPAPIACPGWSSASCSSARPRTSTSASPPARRCRRSCATTAPQLPYSQGTPVSVALPADALRVLPDPGVSVAEIHDERPPAIRCST